MNVQANERKYDTLVLKCTICNFSCKPERVLINQNNKKLKDKEVTLQEVPVYESSLEISLVFCKRSEEA